jgi:TM2 domain-containing membrane protein YozV
MRNPETIAPYTQTASDLQENEFMPEQQGPSKVTCGILAILLGWTGIHKFILGMTTPGIIMLVISLCTVGSIGSLIGLIEGIIYLTKTDEEFYQMYVVEKKQWF